MLRRTARDLSVRYTLQIDTMNIPQRYVASGEWRVAGLTDGIKTLETYCLGAADSVWLPSTPLVAECKPNFFISKHALARCVLPLLRRHKVMKFQFYVFVY